MILAVAVEVTTMTEAECAEEREVTLVFLPRLPQIFSVLCFGDGDGGIRSRSNSGSKHSNKTWSNYATTNGR